MSAGSESECDTRSGPLLGVMHPDRQMHAREAKRNLVIFPPFGGFILENVGEIELLGGDVLNAQQALLNARVQLVSGGSTVKSSPPTRCFGHGHLSTANLGVAVARYDPKVHFNQVRDKWFRTCARRKASERRLA